MLRKIPTVLVGVYLILVLLGIIPIFTDGESLSGIFAFLLALPWSIVLGHLLPGHGVSTGLTIVAISTAINAAIIYYLSRWLVGWVA